MGAALGHGAWYRRPHEEIAKVYDSSALLPLIGADQPDIVIKSAKIKRISPSSKHPDDAILQPTSDCIYLVFEGAIDVYCKGVCVRQLCIDRMPIVSNSKTMTSTLTTTPSGRSRRSRAASAVRSLQNDDVMDTEEILIYAKNDKEFLCRYSCSTAGEEVILKSVIADRIVARDPIRYLCLSTHHILQQRQQKAKPPDQSIREGKADPDARSPPSQSRHRPLQSIDAITSSDVLELLAGIPFFASISREKLVVLTELSTIRVYPTDAIIFREDEGWSTQMFITLAGSVEVSSSKANTPLAKLEAGSFFGEMSLLINIPRAATVRVVESCMLMSIEKEAFHAFLAKSPEIKASVYNLLKERLLTKAMLSGVLPFFKSLPLPRLIQFSHELQIEDQIRKGDCVLNQELGDQQFGFLVYGALEICSQELIRRQTMVQSAAATVSRKQPPHHLPPLASPKAAQPTPVHTNPGTPPVGASVFLTPGCYFGPFVFTRLGIPNHGRIVAKSSVVILSCPMPRLMQLFAEFPLVAAEANIAWFGERCDISTVLRHTVLTQRFQAFLEAEHSDENFSFCVDVEKFRAAATVEERMHLAIYLRDRYIVSEAPKEVNLPAAIRDVLLDKIKKATSDPPGLASSVFDPAFDEIMKLMMKDSFPRFKRTPMFQNMLQTLDPQLTKKGSALVEACHAFRESISVLRPGQVENVRVGRLNQMMTAIRKKSDVAATANVLQALETGGVPPPESPKHKVTPASSPTGSSSGPKLTDLAKVRPEG